MTGRQERNLRTLFDPISAPSRLTARDQADGLALLAEVERLRGQVDRLTAEALRFYRADGTYEVLESAAEVVARRRAAAARLAALEAAAAGASGPDAPGGRV